MVYFHACFAEMILHMNYEFMMVPRCAVLHLIMLFFFAKYLIMLLSVDWLDWSLYHFSDFPSLDIFR